MTTHPCDILPSLQVPSSVTHPTLPELKVCEISVGKLSHTSCVNGTQGYNTLLSQDRNSEIMTAIPGESLMWILIKIHRLIFFETVRVFFVVTSTWKTAPQRSVSDSQKHTGSTKLSVIIKDMLCIQECF